MDRVTDRLWTVLNDPELMDQDTKTYPKGMADDRLWTVLDNPGLMDTPERVFPRANYIPIQRLSGTGEDARYFDQTWLGKNQGYYDQTWQAMGHKGADFYADRPGYQFAEVAAGINGLVFNWGGPQTDTPSPMAKQIIFYTTNLQDLGGFGPAGMAVGIYRASNQKIYAWDAFTDGGPTVADFLVGNWGRFRSGHDLALVAKQMGYRPVFIGYSEDFAVPAGLVAAVGRHEQSHTARNVIAVGLAAALGFVAVKAIAR